jgi:hypothetical protein
MLTDFRKVLNRVTVPAGWESGAVTSKMFRHTYCSARLATLDRGAPVSQDTVFVQHREILGDRLDALCRNFGVGIGTAGGTTAVELT